MNSQVSTILLAFMASLSSILTAPATHAQIIAAPTILTPPGNTEILPSAASSINQQAGVIQNNGLSYSLC